MSTRHVGDEEARLAALASYAVDEPEVLRELQELAKRSVAICGVPMAGVVLLERDRIRIIGPVGIQPPPLPRQSTITEHATFQDSLFLVPNTLEDPRFSNATIVIGTMRIRFYGAVPLITPEGHHIGVFSILDVVPRDLTEAQRTAIVALAREAMDVLEKRRRERREKQSEATSTGLPLVAGSAALALVMIFTIVIASVLHHRAGEERRESSDRAAAAVAKLLGDCVAAVQRVRAAATRGGAPWIGADLSQAPGPLAFLPVDRLTPANAASVIWLAAPPAQRAEVVGVAPQLRAVTARTRDDAGLELTAAGPWFAGLPERPLLVAAVYNRVLLPDAETSDRRDATAGWLLIPIDLESTIAAATAPDVAVAVYDGRHSLRRRLLVRGTPADHASSPNSSRSIQVLGETWIVEAGPSQHAPAASARLYLTLIIGILLALAAAFAAYRFATIRLTRSSTP